MSAIGEGERPAECAPGQAPDEEQLSWDVFDGGNFSDDGDRTRQRCEDISAHLLLHYDIRRKFSAEPEQAQRETIRRPRTHTAHKHRR